MTSNVNSSDDDCPAPAPSAITETGIRDAVITAASAMLVIFPANFITISFLLLKVPYITHMSVNHDISLKQIFRHVIMETNYKSSFNCANTYTAFYGNQLFFTCRCS
jgi:hypothetical protein